MSAKKTHEEFLSQMLTINPSIQPISEYVAAAKSIECRCNVCRHEWTSLPNRLLRGTGCPKCTGRVNPTLEELQEQLDFLGKDFEVSGEFNKSTDLISVKCRLCLFEWESLSNVLRRDCTSCRSCRDNGQRTSKEHTRFEKTKNNLILNLSKRGLVLANDYLIGQKEVEVKCTVCEREWTTAISSAGYNGCARCSKKETYTTDQFKEYLEKAEKKIELLSEYKGAHVKVSCLCQICNTKWSVTPGNLKDGTGCPSCARTGFDPSKPGYLYYLRIKEKDETYWKVGITNLTLKRRFRPQDREKITVLNTIYFEDGATAYQCEQNILRLYKEYKAYNVTPLRAGNTELFLKDVLQMDHLLEVTDGFS